MALVLFRHKITRAVDTRLFEQVTTTLQEPQLVIDTLVL